MNPNEILTALNKKRLESEDPKDKLLYEESMQLLSSALTRNADLEETISGIRQLVKRCV